MKIISSGLLAVLIILGSFGAVGTNTTLKNENIVNDKLEYVSGEVILCFHTQLDDLDPINVNEIESFEGKNIKEKIAEMNIAVVVVNEGEELDYIDIVTNSPYVAYAELNIIFRATFTPNDPEWNEQWGPKKINCEEAWDNEQGSSTVRIAIADTGIDYNHADLSPNYVTGGYDHINNDNDPMDDAGHGTHCAGIAAARINNGIGIAGVAGKCSLISEKVLDDDGYGTSTSVANGINHAVGQGADVISLSLSADSPSSTIETACNNAYNSGVLLVAASGNDGSSVDWPAAYNTVAAIGATDQSDNRCSFSNYGSEMELVAPGKDIWATKMGGGYCYKTGTSMATPHVAGVAGLVFSANPGISNIEVRQILRNTAKDLGASGWDQYYGYGRVDAEAAVGSSYTEVTKYANQYYQKDDWWSWGNHGMQSDNYWFGGPDYIYYEFNNIPHNTQEDILLGSEFKADIIGGNQGPDLEAKNPSTGSWDVIKQSMGGPSSLVWKWYSASKNYISSANKVQIRIVCSWGCHAYVDEVGVQYVPVPPPEPNLQAWVDDPLRWTGVEPGSTKTGTIFVKNIGETGSKLDWVVSESLDWVSCSPTSGQDLQPGTTKSITVTVTASSQGNDPRTGTITVKNAENSGDKETFEVNIVTKKSRTRTFFFQILEMFPLLQQLLQMRGI